MAAMRSCDHLIMQISKILFFPLSPTSCPPQRTKRISKKAFISIFWHLFQNYLFSSKKGLAQGVGLPLAVKGLRVSSHVWPLGGILT